MIPGMVAVTGRVVGRAGANVFVLGSADGTAVAVPRSAVVATPPAAGGVEAEVVVALGGSGVDAIGAGVVVSWPKAIPVRHAVAKLQSRGEGQAPIFPPRNEGAGREAGPAADLPLLTAYPAPGPCPAPSADADHAAWADRPPPNKGGV